MLKFHVMRKLCSARLHYFARHEELGASVLAARMMEISHAVDDVQHLSYCNCFECFVLATQGNLHSANFSLESNHQLSTSSVARSGSALRGLEYVESERNTKARIVCKRWRASQD